MNEKQLQFKSTFTDPVLISGDVDRITQVLTNLFENALRYSPQHGTVELAIMEQENAIRFSISNECEDIPNDASKLFERFQRGETSRSREYGGAGLGLAIVRELVHAHGGQVGSRFHQHKAYFWFELPAMQ